MQTPHELSEALRERRKALGLSQKDMLTRIGMPQQQYQRLEAGTDTRVSSLFRVLEGLDLELVLVPKAQADASAPSAKANGASQTLDWAKLFDELADDDT